MNLEQLKRNDLSNGGNASYFAKAITGREFRYGPAIISELLTEAFLSANESFSAQAWFSVLAFLSKYNGEYIANKSSEKSFSENEIVQSYTRLIENIFKSFYAQEVTLAFFINYRKWAKKIMNELDSQWKATIYAIDAYFYEVLKNVGYRSLKDVLKDESLKVKTMASSYFAFICKNEDK